MNGCWKKMEGWGPKRASKFQKPVSTYLCFELVLLASLDADGLCVPVCRHLFEAHLEEDLPEFSPDFVY